MHAYHVILVNGKLAIKWEDETHLEAIERARAERNMNAALLGRAWLSGARGMGTPAEGRAGRAGAHESTLVGTGRSRLNNRL